MNYQRGKALLFPVPRAERTNKWMPSPQSVTLPPMPTQLVNPYLESLPFLPTLHQEGEVYSQLTLTMRMLPSVNRKYGHGHHINPQYRAQEEEEGLRLAAQRLFVQEWQHDKNDHYLLGYVFSYGSWREDVHNPTKPTCDLLSAGHWKSLGSGTRKRKVWIPYGDILCNDNRVMGEWNIKWVQPQLEEHWCILVVTKWHKRDDALIPYAHLAHAFYTHYSTPFPLESHSPSYSL